MTVSVPIEIDVTYVNKKWMPESKKNFKPEYIIGFFRRKVDGVVQCSIRAIPDNSPETIAKEVLAKAPKGAVLYAEEGILPESLDEHYSIFELKNGQYVDGDIHINNIKSVWRDLKRTIKNVYHDISNKHLQSYLDELAWKINHQHLSNIDKFHAAMQGIANGKRTTYQDLIK